MVGFYFGVQDVSSLNETRPGAGNQRFNTFVILCQRFAPITGLSSTCQAIGGTPYKTGFRNGTCSVRDRGSLRRNSYVIIVQSEWVRKALQEASRGRAVQEDGELMVYANNKYY